MKRIVGSAVSAAALALCIAAAAVLVSCAEAEEEGRDIYIVCGLPAFASLADGFYEEMEELGYAESESLRYHRFDTATGSPEEAEILRNAVEDDADLILAFPTGTAAAAKTAAAGSVPVLIGMANLEGTGIIENTQEPGGNITGVRAPSTEVVLTRLEYLTFLMEPNGRVLVPYSESYLANQPILAELRTAAVRLGIDLHELPVVDVPDLGARLNILAEPGSPRIDGILISADSISQSVQGWEAIRGFAEAQRIPVSGAAPSQAEDGAVISIAVDYFETGKLAALSADKILRGIDAGTIPVMTARLALTINLDAAEALGIEMPSELVNLASRIIR